MRRIIYIFLMIIVFSVALPVAVPATVNAQSSSPTGLIDTVNTLRANNGLTALQVDQALMASAQQHAEYMAQTSNITHTRADGSTPATLGFIENIAGGINLTVDVVVYSMWTDADHWGTMVNFTYGKVGAGVAVKDNWVYYVLQVQRIDTGLAGQPTPNLQNTADPNTVAQVITATPQLDGSIFHEVGAGQSLWSIALAYGITIADIIAWNNLQPTPNIFPGERLLVVQPPTPTLSPTITLTPIPATRTTTPTATPKTPTVTATITLTPTITPRPPFSIQKMETGKRKTIGIGITAICSLGLLFSLYVGFIRKDKQPRL